MKHFFVPRPGTIYRVSWIEWWKQFFETSSFYQWKLRSKIWSSWKYKWTKFFEGDFQWWKLRIIKIRFHNSIRETLEKVLGRGIKIFRNFEKNLQSLIFNFPVIFKFLSLWIPPWKRFQFYRQRLLEHHHKLEYLREGFFIARKWQHSCCWHHAFGDRKFWCFVTR